MTRVWIGATMAFCLCIQSARGDQPGQGEKAITAPSSLAPSTFSVPAQAPTTFEAVRAMPEREVDGRHIKAVLQLKSVPAVNLAATINTLLAADGQVPPNIAPRVVIVADAMSNCLVVAGSAEAVEAVEKLVAKLDRVAAMVRMVHLEIVVGDVPVGQAAPGPVFEPTPETLRKQMEVLIQAEVTTLDNQPAKLQVGVRQPRITGATTTRDGQVNTITTENVGTILSVTPRIGADGVVFLALNLEDSRLGPEEDGVPIAVRGEGKVVRSPRTELLTIQSTLRAADGQTVVAGGMARQAKAGKQRVVLVTPHLLATGAQVKQEK